MTIKSPTFLFALLPALLLTGACTSLKHVSDFSTAAEKSITGYNTLAYSYEMHCQADCRQAYEAKLLKGTAAFSLTFQPACDCAAARAKDEDAKKAYTTLLLYFAGLEKLSAGDRFIYKTSDLIGAMGKARIISNDDLKAPVSSIADIVINMATNAYREHALETILDKAKTPVDQLLADLIASNEILAADSKNDLKQFQGLLALNYTGEKPPAPSQQLNDYRVNNAAEEASDATQKSLADFNALLQKIRDAHLKLANERMNLKDKDLITYLFTQANQLRTNISKL
ncbi:MAG: hypothetical protein ABI308_09335 [Mucilaginibacter sp.]